MASEETMYCLCREPYDKTRFMIECDVCKDWFHGSCVGVQEYQASDIEVYHCPTCAKICGPLILKSKRNIHRHDYSEDSVTAKAVQTGTLMFVKELENRTFPSADEIPILKLPGHQVNVENIVEKGFDVPIIIDKKDGLGLTVPPSNFRIQDVEEHVGPMREIDVIDVNKQEDYKMLMREWTEYYNSPNRTKVFNVISLEFSKTSLSNLVIPPTVVRQLSWASNIWPEQHTDDAQYVKPEIQKYCLMGVKDSFTDFHIDFGGTSVWYHVLRGEKIFYLIKPTNANLTLYEHWISSASQTENFFGDQADVCYKCVVKQGQTLFIPTAWIHAVLTPVDSLVFGGNFLHSLNIPLQLQIYGIEKRVSTPEKYQYPNYETIHWYAAKHILDILKDYTDEERKPPNYLLQGAKSLVTALKSWSQKRDGQIPKIHRDCIPEAVQYGKLLKDLAKEVKHIEKPNIKQKPEKKKKKKAVVSKVKQSLDVLDQHTKKKLKEERKSLKQSQTKESPFSLKVRIPKGGLKGKSRPSPTSLRLKLANGKIISGGPVTKSSPDKFQPLKTEANSDSDSDQLVVDEIPQKSRLKKESSIEKQGSLKLKLSFAGKNVQDLSSSQDSSLNTSQSDSAFSSPEKGLHKSDPDSTGINDILEASGYGTEADVKADMIGNTMRDAIQGMLSMSQMGGLQLTSGGESPFIVRPRANIKLKQSQNLIDDYGEKMPTCYKDDTFIYPTLEASDGEDGHIFKPRGRPKKDETWNPKAKLAPNIPKPERPVRENAKRESVESGLATAAANLANRPKQKRQYIRRKQKPEKMDSHLTHSLSGFSYDDEQPSTSSFNPSSSAPASLFQHSGLGKRPFGSQEGLPKHKKTKKGQATAKQRLGKLLKMHKMKL